MYPARYQVLRQMLNFLQYILQQPSESLLHSMLQAQMKNPSKGDWVSTVKELLKKYQIKLDMIEIKNTKQSIFKKMVKRLEMSDYLLPECKISEEDKI